MSESFDYPPTGQPQPASDDSWQEVGKQFKKFGESLSQAFRTAWESEQTRREMRQVQDGLEVMVNEVSQAIKDTANSPAGQQFQQGAKTAADNLRSASEKTAQEARPHLVSALKDVNSALQKMIDKMETQDQPHDTQPPEAPGE